MSHGKALVAAFLGVLVGGLSAALATTAVDVVQSAMADGSETVAAASTIYPARPIPPEWRWEPKGVEYQHMYRATPPQGIDWIR